MRPETRLKARLKARLEASLKRSRLALIAMTIAAGPALAQDYAVHPLRYGITSDFWHFDARNDERDFPNNGFFPGNFAADPWAASIGTAGFLEVNPYRSAWPYPSQVYFGGPVVRTEENYCGFRAYDPATGTYRGKDGRRVAARRCPRGGELALRRRPPKDR